MMGWVAPFMWGMGRLIAFALQLAGVAGLCALGVAGLAAAARRVIALDEE